MNEFFYEFLEVSNDEVPIISLKNDAYSVLLNSSVVKLQGDGLYQQDSSSLYKITSGYRSNTRGGIFLNPNVSVYPSVVTTKREKINDLLFLLIKANEQPFDTIRDLNAFLGSYVSSSFTMSVGVSTNGQSYLLFVGKISNNYDPEDSQNTLDYVATIDGVMSAVIVRPTASTASIDSFLLQSLDNGSPLESSNMSFQQSPQIERPKFSLEQSPLVASPKLTFQQSKKL